MRQATWKYLILFAATIVYGPGLLAMADDAESRLRVLSYNIHHGEGTDGQLDLPRIAEVIRRARPDIVALQEVDVRTRRSADVDQAAELARLLDMDYRFGKSIGYAGGEYGNAVLSRWEIAHSQVHELPAPARTTERRTILEVHVRLPESLQHGGQTQVGIFGTHWDHQRPEENRIASARFVNEHLLSVDKRAASSHVGNWLLAGDLNAMPESKPLQVLAEHWQQTEAEYLTSPASAPRRQIDYLLPWASGSLELVEYQVLDEPVASDHRPLLGIFKLRDTGSE